ncbi:hypothetical protein L3X38_035693 [Prunus dulcis]|uniref:Uncharacterized protein n=1 Tax=Prunus dulcis TaxID=3755 RepID=A0AAD4YZ20_PRUDU|nr:hypothetical protein L3X38_035693 [Prunus dulcis]
MRHWRGPFPPPVKDIESKIIEDRQIGGQNLDLRTSGLFGCGALAHGGVMDLQWFPRMYHRLVYIFLQHGLMYKHLAYPSLSSHLFQLLKNSHCQTNNLTSGFSLNQDFFFYFLLEATACQCCRLWDEEAESVELQSNFFFLSRENVL